MKTELTKDKWAVIEIVDDRILQCLVAGDCKLIPSTLIRKQDAINCAVDLAMENGCRSSRTAAADILDNDERLFVGNWAVHIILIPRMF